MSKTTDSAVVVPTEEGKPMMDQAAGVAKMSGGGLLLTPLPLGGGKRRSRKISKKVLKQLKKMGSRKVMKMLKKGGAEDEMMTADAPEEPTEGASRRRKTRRGGRKHSRRSMY
jgi:hypothetical protein